MRLHIEIDDELIERLDNAAGPRGRSRFIREAVEAALDQWARWQLIRSSSGTIRDRGHDWDDDPGGWVQRQRRGDRKRVG